MIKDRQQLDRAFHFIMELLSTPRHSAKLCGRYVSSAPSYVPAFFEKLKTVTRDSAFWRPKR